MTKTFRIAVVCAVLFCLTLPAPASAQYEEARRLALAAMSSEERDVFEQTSEKTREEFAQTVRDSAAKLFAALGKEPETRKYSEEERPYVGEEGRLTQEQVAALKTFVDPALEAPRRDLNADEIKTVAQAFDLSEDDVALKNRALRARLDVFAGDSSAPMTGRLLFGVKLADNMARASLDEIQPGISAALENHSPTDVLDEVRDWPPIGSLPVLYCLLERFGDRMDDLAYARVLNETVATLSSLGRLRRMNLVPAPGLNPQTLVEPDTQFAPDVIEKLIDAAWETRPDSWEVSLVYAKTIWEGLPKTFKPGDSPDDAPRRVFYPKNAQLEGTLYSEARDRVLVLRALSKNLVKAIDAEGTTPKTADNTISPTSYFGTLAGALCCESDKGRVADLNAKTDLGKLPPFRKADQTEASHENKNGGVQQDPIRTPFFENAENDGERYAYAQILLDADRELQNGEYSSARFLAILGSMLRARLGVQDFLYQAKDLRTSLNVRYDDVSPDARPDRVVRETARVDAAIAEVPTLRDNETIVYRHADPRPFGYGFSDENAEEFQPKRRTLAPSENFIAALKRSLEQEENYKALYSLATEYQLRGKYDLATEYWNRAKTAKTYEKDENKVRVIGNNPNALRENPFWPDMALEKLNAPGEVEVDAQNTRVDGMSVTLDVVSRGARNLKTTFYQLDLAPFVARAIEPTFYRVQERFFADLVCEGVREKLDRGEEIASFAKEARVSTDAAGATSRTRLTFAMEKPGAYLVRVADAANEEIGAYALAFVNRYAFDYQTGHASRDGEQGDRVVVSDLQTGKPLANRDVELFAAYTGATPRLDAKTTTVKTDENGAFVTPQNTGFLRLLAFVQDEAEDESDRSVSVFDSQESRLSKAIYKFTPRVGFGEKLVLTTNRPIYAPGETVEFSAQIVPQPGFNTFDPKVPRRVMVSFKGNPRGGPTTKKLPVADFDVVCDETGAFSGSFQIPEDAQRGEYRFTCGKNVKRDDLVIFCPVGEENRDPDEPVFVASSNSTIFVSERPDDDEATRQKKAEEAAKKAYFAELAKRERERNAVKETNVKPSFEVTFNKPIYYVKDEEAQILVSSSNKRNAVASFYKIGRNGSKTDPETVELREGNADWRCPLDKSDAPCFTLVVTLVGGDKAETAFYLVGVQNASTERAVSLDAPKKVKAGEATRLNATFARSEDDGSLFAGRATLALYDERLAVVPEDSFKSYVAATRFENRLLARYELASPPVMSPYGFIPFVADDDARRRKEERRIYDDFVAPPARLPRKRFAPVDNPNDDPFGTRPVEFLVRETPDIPEEASYDSFVKEATVSERTDAVSFEFDAPKTPGTYRLVFRAFDIEKGASSFAEQTLIVE